MNEVRLGDVCQQERETVKPGQRPELRYIGMESIEAGSGVFAEGELSKTPETPIANSFRFGPEHVLYGKLRPYLNKVAIPDFEGKCSTEIIPLRPNERIERAYLAYFLRSGRVVEQISERTAGARMPRADMDFVLSLPISLPNRTEQRRIVELLSRAEGIVRLRREAEKKAAELIPAIFLDMFGDPATNPKGWQSGKLADVVADMRNGFNPTKDQFGTGTRFVTVNDLYSGLTIDVAAADRVSVDQTVINKYRLHRGDLCFVRSSVKRAGVGMASVFDGDEVAIFGGFVIRAQLTKSLSPMFACSMFHVPSIRKIVVESAGTGTITNINQPALLGVPIIQPPIRLQLAFLEKAAAIRSINVQQSAALRTAKFTFDALLAQSFSTTERICG